jgi:hypothetical protein
VEVEVEGRWEPAKWDARERKKAAP